MIKSPTTQVNKFGYKVATGYLLLAVSVVVMVLFASSKSSAQVTGCIYQQSSNQWLNSVGAVCVPTADDAQNSGLYSSYANSLQNPYGNSLPNYGANSLLISPSSSGSSSYVAPSSISGSFSATGGSSGAGLSVSISSNDTLGKTPLSLYVTNNTGMNGLIADLRISSNQYDQQVATMLNSYQQWGATFNNVLNTFGQGEATVQDLRNMIATNNVNPAQLSNFMGNLTATGLMASQAVGSNTTLGQLLGSFSGYTAAGGVGLTGVNQILNAFQSGNVNTGSIMQAYGGLTNMVGALAKITDSQSAAGIFSTLLQNGGAVAGLANSGMQIKGLVDAMSSGNLSLANSQLGTFFSNGGTMAQLTSSYGSLGGAISSFGGGSGLIGTAGSLAGGISNPRTALDSAQMAQDKATLETERETAYTTAMADCESTIDAESAYSVAAGKAAGAAGSAIYVPVAEKGELLSLAQSDNKLVGDIDWYTQRNEDTAYKICVQLKLLKRTEYSMEDKAYVSDPALARQSSTALDSYTQSYFNMLKTGYSPSSVAESGALNQGGASLYMPISNYVQQEKNNAAAVFFDSERSNPYLAQLKVTLQTPGASVGTTLSTQQIQQFESGSQAAGVSPDQQWAMWDAYYDPNLSNNLRTSTLNASEAYYQMQQEAANNARQTWDEGYVPIEKCIRPTSDGLGCIERQTITPAGAVRVGADNAMDSRRQLYTNPQAGLVGNGNQPVASQISSFSPASILGIIGGAASNLMQLESLLDDSKGKDKGHKNGSHDAQNNSGTDNGTSGTGQINLTLSSTPDRALTTIRWSANNVSQCQVGGDFWLGTNDAGQVSVVKRGGEQISLAGALTIHRPLAFSVGASDGTIATSTDAITNAMVIKWTPPTNINSKGVYTLSITDADNSTGRTITVNGNNNEILPTTPTGLIEQLIGVASQDPNLEAYTFTDNLGFLTISVKNPTYSIDCLDNSGKVVSKSL